MGLKQEIDKLYQGALLTAYRYDLPAPTAAIYTNTTYSLFTITGGPVYLAYLIGRVRGAAGLASGSTFHFHVCGVNASGAAANANTVDNGIIEACLNAASGPTFNVLARSVTTLAVASNGMVASVGLVELVAAGGATTVGVGVEWILAYRKLHPTSRVIAS